MEVDRNLLELPLKKQMMWTTGVVSIPFSCVGKGSGVRIGRVRDTTGEKCRLAPCRTAPGAVQPCLASAQHSLYLVQ